jgi:hypothetical protein
MLEPVLWRPSVSFCIITNGKKPEKLRRQIESIVSLKIPSVEVILSGRPPEFPGYPWLKLVAAPEAADKGQLGAMRNAACEVATGDVLVVADDDMIYLPDFYEGLCRFGPDFSLCGCRILNTDGSRFYDKAEIGGPGGHRLLSYEEESEWVYVTGGLAILRPDLFRHVRWDEGRGFYCDEDVDFSRRVQQAGFRISFNPRCAVIHDDDRYYQFGTTVDIVDTPGLWREVLPGVMGRGIYRRIRDGFHTASTIEFRFSPVKQGAKLDFGLTIFPAVEVYGTDKVRADIYSDRQKVGEIVFDRPEQTVHLSLMLGPGSQEVSVSFDPPANLATFGTRDGRTVGGYIYAMSAEGVDPAGISPADTYSEKTLLYLPLLGSSQLAYALRGILLGEEFEQVSREYFLSNFESDLAVVGTRREFYLKRFRESSMALEVPRSCLLFHDYRYPVGSNFFRPRVNGWVSAAVAAPVQALEDSVLSGFVAGDYSPVCFNIEDLALLVEAGIAEDRLMYLPLLPKAPRLTETERDVVFVNLYWGGGAEYLEQIVGLIREEKTKNFLIWVDSHIMEREVLNLTERDSRVTIITGSLPDADLELMLRRVKVALCPNRSDPYGFFVRQLLVSGVPVIGTKVGARKDLPERCGFMELSDIRTSFASMQADYANWRAQCLDFRARSEQDAGSLDYLKLITQRFSGEARAGELRV